MFYLDKVLYRYIYMHCSKLGSTFGFGAIEGFIMYLIMILGTTVAILEKRKRK